MPEEPEDFHKTHESVSKEDGMAVIRFPLSEVQGWRSVLSPCPCKATKSSSGVAMRASLVKALGKLIS